MSRCSVAFLVVLFVPAVAGCQGPWSFAPAKPPALATLPTDSAALSTAKPLAVDVQPGEKAYEESLAKVVDELIEADALDAEAKRMLMADLRAAKPENWPLIVQSFRSALAYRKQLAAREQKAAAEPLIAEQRTESVDSKQTTPPPAANPYVSRLLEAPVSFDTQRTEPSEAAERVTTTNRAAPRAEPVLPVTPVVLSQPPQHVVQQSSYLANVPPTQPAPHEWQGHLQSAIQDLQANISPAPGSTDEVNEHMRLRLLQLLSGNEEAAMQPVPGATASQQDYWSKQLFSVSTYLDSKRQPDDKRRAAGSLMHLDQARAKLAELATLQVRKLAFVDAVEGYGDYQLHEGEKFRPGDQVTLYAEIENFTSESTKEGYRTRLGTSYEVIDKNGKRVDSAQFPEVEDLCRNPRRDFHMQYTVTLPTRIYPDQYEIRLIITDQQSHKIGQATVAFEIAE